MLAGYIDKSVISFQLVRAGQIWFYVFWRWEVTKVRTHNSMLARQALCFAELNPWPSDLILGKTKENKPQHWPHEGAPRSLEKSWHLEPETGWSHRR